MLLDVSLADAQSSHLASLCKGRDESTDGHTQINMLTAGSVFICVSPSVLSSLPPHTDEHADSQYHRCKGRQAGRNTDRQADDWTDKQTNRQSYIHAYRQAHRLTDRQHTDRQRLTVCQMKCTSLDLIG